MTVLGVVILLWYGWRSVALARDFAIVMTEKSDVLSSPNDGATQLFSLHSGTKVRQEKRWQGGRRSRCLMDEKGWIPTDAIERI